MRTGSDAKKLGWDGADWVFVVQDMNKGRGSAEGPGPLQMTN
jgi:hypothetical protein